jgi:isopenicillin N synthase-like dioxygenase
MLLRTRAAAVGARLAAWRRLSSSGAAARVEVVTLAYDDLVAGVDLTAEIGRAFGYDGLGLLTVRGVPGFEARRQALLPLSREFARLPEPTKRSYEHERSFYAFGWSHGKEMLQGGVPDLAKGSYYNNPQHNDPFRDEPELVERWPSFCHRNIWPDEELPALEPAFMGMGSLVCEVGFLVAKQCDAYIKQRHDGYEAEKLFGLIRDSRVAKARLLHYFPTDSDEAQGASSSSHASSSPPGGLARSLSRSLSVADEDFGSWCGWHNDHGSLTGLVPGMLIDDATGAEVDAAAVERIRAKDPFAADQIEAAGLYIQTRSGQIVRATVPSDHVGFQIGETAQIHSGGVLQATPHAVRGAGVPGVSRESFAVFMEPEWGEPMTVPEGMDPVAAQSPEAAASLPAGVPPLSRRWGTEECAFSTCDFGTFSEITYGAYLAPGDGAEGDERA